MKLVINITSKDSFVAIVDSEGKIEKISWQSDFKQSEELLPKIDKLIKRKKLDIGGITGVIVINGPGSYTGIRVSVSVANAIGYSREIPVIGISLLAIVNSIENESGVDKLIIPIIKSVADKYYYEIYDKDSELLESGNKNIKDIIADKKEKIKFIGQIKKEDRDHLEENKINFINKKYSDNKLIEGAFSILKELNVSDEKMLAAPYYINKPNITYENEAKY